MKVSKDVFTCTGCQFSSISVMNSGELLLRRPTSPCSETELRSSFYVSRTEKRLCVEDRDPQELSQPRSELEFRFLHLKSDRTTLSQSNDPTSCYAPPKRSILREWKYRIFKSEFRKIVVIKYRLMRVDKEY